MAISIKFPFKETREGGVFYANDTTLAAIQTNLVSLLTTKRKNRVMRTNLYSPIWDFIFEPWDDISSTRLRDELIEKIGEYISEVEVVDIIFNFTEEENLLEIKIVYEVVSLGGVQDVVNVVIPVEPGEVGGDDHSHF